MRRTPIEITWPLDERLRVVASELDFEWELDDTVARLGGLGVELVPG